MSIFRKEKPKWIRVNKQLPAKNKTVLVFFNFLFSCGWTMGYLTSSKCDGRLVWRIIVAIQEEEEGFSLEEAEYEFDCVNKWMEFPEDPL